MKSFDEIQVHMLAHTHVDENAVHGWLDKLGVSRDYELPAVDDPALLVALAAKRCYMSFEEGLNVNVTRVRKDIVEYLDNILKSGHGSVLEHATYTFAFEGVSRVFTGEMNRHRAGVAISEGSMRFIRYDDISFWMPESLQACPFDDDSLAWRKVATRAIFYKVFATAEDAYVGLLKIWDMDAGDKNFDYKKKITSCLRRIIPMGVATGGVWTMNLRALRHIIALRTSAAAEEEIAHVFRKVLDLMRSAEPELFGDFDESGNCKYPKV